MSLPPEVMRALILGMRAAYARGDNAMAYARELLGASGNSADATLVAYDLQTGNYVAKALRNLEENQRWGAQLATYLAGGLPPGGSLLEVGVGEATTLTSVTAALSPTPGRLHGLDLSWSRCVEGRAWLERGGVEAELVVGDLFALPFADDSVDVVYTAHSLEPNGGREREALTELLRVARHRLVLCEPIYELGSPEAQARMRSHGYVRDLAATLASLGAPPSVCRLLPDSPKPLNPSGVIVVDKRPPAAAAESMQAWRCPLTHTPLSRREDVFVSDSTGIAYPVLRGIPLLRPEHAVVASRLVAAPPGV